MSLSRIFVVGLVALAIPGARVFGQFGSLRQAERKMDQGNWASAQQILLKALNKDSLNVEAELLLSRWFFNQKNPNRHFDSAYQHNLRALHSFQKSSIKQKEKLIQDHADSSTIVRLRLRIDSAAFAEAKHVN